MSADAYMTFYMYAGSTIVPLTTFVVGNIFFIVLDLTGKPSVMLKYKIQDEKHVPVSDLMNFN